MRVPDLAEGDGGWGHFATSLGLPTDSDNAVFPMLYGGSHFKKENLFGINLQGTLLALKMLL